MLVSATLVVMTCAVPAAAQNLLKNGSFEQGPEPGSFVTLQPGDKSIPGWVVTHASIDYIGREWKCSQGKRCLDLDGTPGFGGIQQTLATTPGQKYRVSFDLEGNAGCNPVVKKMRVSAAGQSHDFRFDTSPKNHSNATMHWVRRTWEFSARAARTTIEFYSLDKEDGRCGPALDNVSVEAIKEVDEKPK